jgi:hypothetical protein
MRWSVYVARIGIEDECIWDIGVKTRRKETTRKTKRCVHNVKMYLRELGWGGIDWIDLAQDKDWWRALVNTVMNLQDP